MKCRLIMLAMPLLCAGIARGQDDAAARIAERVRVPLATLPQLKEAPPMNAAPDFKGWARDPLLRPVPEQRGGRQLPGCLLARTQGRIVEIERPADRNHSCLTENGNNHP